MTSRWRLLGWVVVCRLHLLLVAAAAAAVVGGEGWVGIGAGVSGGRLTW